MMKVVFAFTGALALTVLPAMAQVSPAPAGPGGPSGAMRGQFMQVHRRFALIRAQERTQMLGALTPAHKALLGQVAGQLATAAAPNVDAAAARLDAALSAGEKQAILNAAQSAFGKMRAAMQQMYAGVSPPPGHPMMGMGVHSGMLGPGARGTQDAGYLLLRVTVSEPLMQGMIPMR